MIRKATAKRSEADAAVRRRSTGLDQRFKMSASVAGFPSIYIATACLSFFVARVGARWGSGDTQCCNFYKSPSELLIRLYEWTNAQCTSFAASQS